MRDAFEEAAASGTAHNSAETPALRVPVTNQALDPGTIFVRDQLNSALDFRTKDETGRAFDSLVKAIEHLMSSYSGESDRERRVSFFRDMARADDCWSLFVDHRSSLALASGELRYYASTINEPAAVRLVLLGHKLQTAVTSNNREQAATCLADWVGRLRGGRFHGDPAFSGRNIRVVHKMEAVLDLLTSVIESHQNRTPCADKDPGSCTT